MIHIIDDFYPNPDVVREQALEMFYYPGGRGDRVFFPGDRTLSTYSHDNRIFIKNRFESTIGKRIIYFPTKNSNTAFTIGLYKGVKEFLNWIHHDCAGYLERTTNKINGTAWASVCFLQPEADINTGTALYRSKKTKKIYKTKELSIDRTATFKGNWLDKPNKDWEIHTYVGNIYNRCVIYPATYWHAPINASFGETKEDARLVQVCFFTTEK